MNTPALVPTVKSPSRITNVTQAQISTEKKKIILLHRDYFRPLVYDWPV